MRTWLVLKKSEERSEQARMSYNQAYKGLEVDEQKGIGASKKEWLQLRGRRCLWDFQAIPKRQAYLLSLPLPIDKASSYYSLKPSCIATCLYVEALGGLSTYRG